MLSENTGYVQLTEFTPEAGKEVKNAVVSLKESGAKYLILDLRGNPGGLLLEAVNICNLFIPKGKKVVDTKGKLEDSNITYETLNAPVDLEIPVVVIINRGSASASEIVAGTLQDYDRAVVLGERSYGKGLVQVGRPLSYNSQVKITTAKYYTPTGRCIQVLDYSHRREDGSVASIPDSIKKEFRTTHGRKVYDGGGIDPDVKVEAQEAAPRLRRCYMARALFLIMLLNILSLTPPCPRLKNFSLTDQEYLEFITWMKGKSYQAQSPIELELNELTEEAKREKFYNDLKPQLDQIKTKLTESHKNELLSPQRPD
jgi:carboxyl-terminal processing protease